MSGPEILVLRVGLSGPEILHLVCLSSSEIPHLGQTEYTRNARTLMRLSSPEIVARRSV